MPQTIIAIAALIALVVAIPVTWKTAIAAKTKSDAQTVGTAEDKARSIIDEAIKTAESKKRESLIEIKEQSLAAKNEVDKEIKDRRAEISKQEKRIQSKEDLLDRKTEAIEKREADFAAKETALSKRTAAISEQELRIGELEKKKISELETISGMTTAEAKEFLWSSVSTSEGYNCEN